MFSLVSRRLGAALATLAIAAQLIVPGTGVLAANNAPVVQDDYYSTVAGTMLEIGAAGVLANDYDPEGDPITAALFYGSYEGPVGLNSDGSFTFTPNQGFVGTATFTYVAYDDQGNTSGMATVYVDVLPSNYPPVAADDSYQATANTLLEVSAPGVLANDSDPEGDGLTASLFNGSYDGPVGLNPDGSFTFTPNAGFVGTTTFTYVVYDGYGNESNLATVAIEVLSDNAAPVAGDDAYATEPGVLLDVAAPGVLANDADPEGGALTAFLMNGSYDGPVGLNADGSFTFDPAPGFTGTTSFTYVAIDEYGNQSGIATVSIEVGTDTGGSTGGSSGTGSGTGSEMGNHAPTTHHDEYWTFTGVRIAITARTILVNDQDRDGDVLTARLIDGPRHGRVRLNEDGTFSYTPSADYVGEDQFTYQAFDGSSHSKTQKVIITVHRIPHHW